MSTFKVLKDRRFGEGWKIGDVVEMDDQAALVPLQEGDIERYFEGPKEPEGLKAEKKAVKGRKAGKQAK